MTQTVAVLTGDLIGSSKAGLEAVERAMACLATGADRLAVWTGEDTRFTRYRGDGWQIYLSQPRLTLRALLFLTAGLRANDGLMTRISAGIGPVARLAQGDLSAASGVAFTLSGHGLDTLAKRRLTLDVAPATPDWQGALIQMLDWQARRWSAAQGEAMAKALDPDAPTQADMAAQLGITRQALQARLAGAGFEAVQAALTAFERHDFDKGRPHD